VREGQSPFLSQGIEKKGQTLGQLWYLADDFAFSHRGREAGYQIFADTTIRLGHIGRHAYSWEEAGGAQHRYATFKFRVADAGE
jgi:hypothetical protein